MKKHTFLSWALLLAFCSGISACAPGQTERTLNEQAAWASTIGMERNRPQAGAVAAGPGGTARLVGGGLSPVPPPPVIAELAPAPAALAAPPAALPPPAPVISATRAVMPAASSSTPPAGPNAALESERRVVMGELLAWRNAWTDGDLAAYIAHYDPSFNGDLPSRREWEKQRRNRFAHRKITVRIENITVRVEGQQAEANFTQHYLSGPHEDVGAKTLTWRKKAGKWLIVDEKWTKA